MNGQMVARMIVTPQLATAASMLVKLAHPGDASLHRALLKAEPLLITQPWRIAGGILQIASASRQNETHKTDGDYCECPTFAPSVCWHKAAWMMLSTLAAAGLDPIADLPLPAALEYDELPASFLDGDFSAFEDMSLTGHDEYGDVIVRGTGTRLDTRVYFDEVVLPEPVVAVAPFRPGKARTMVPAAGSDWAKAQEAADALFAA